MSQSAANSASPQALNQARAATGWNAFSDDRLLVSIADRFAPWVKEKAAKLGAYAGDEATQDLARLANRHAPELKTHDRFGNRIDWVEFHPAWHDLMALAFGHEVHSLAWTAREPGAHLARGVLSYVWNQIEHGVGCPTGMTYAAYPGLAQPEFACLAREDSLRPLRQAPASLPAEDRRHHRLCHDREAGRVGPAPDADDGPVPGGDARRPRLSAQRPQVVLLGSPVGRFLHACADQDGRDVLLRAGLPARRRAQRGAHPAAQGQVRQPLQCLERDRVSRRYCLARRERKVMAFARSSRTPISRGSISPSARPA